MGQEILQPLWKVKNGTYSMEALWKLNYKDINQDRFDDFNPEDIGATENLDDDIV